jgi:hypothetical protein
LSQFLAHFASQTGLFCRRQTSECDMVRFIAAEAERLLATGLPYMHEQEDTTPLWNTHQSRIFLMPNIRLLIHSPQVSFAHYGQEA